MEKLLTYQELLDELKKIPSLESRMENTNNTEFVIDNQYVMNAHVIFQKFFGEDFKAPGEDPTTEDKRHSARWGGIREDQTLYYHESEGSRQCAMLWPWSDGYRVTVRIANFKEDL